MTLIEVRICPCPVQFPLFDEICFTSWTAKKRLQVPILKEPHSVQLLLRDLYEVSKLEQRPWAFQFSSWSHFWKCSYSFFFSVLTVGRLGEFVQITMYQLKRLLILPACIICSLSSENSDLNVMFLKNVDSESKQQFALVITTGCWY